MLRTVARSYKFLLRRVRDPVTHGTSNRRCANRRSYGVAVRRAHYCSTDLYTHDGHADGDASDDGSDRCADGRTHWFSVRGAKRRANRYPYDGASHGRANGITNADVADFSADGTAYTCLQVCP